MILFSGHGDIATYFSNQYQCEIVSLRHKSIAELENILPEFNVIIHNAANLNPLSLEAATSDNFLLTKNIVDTLVRVNPDAKFIYLSSMSILKSENEYLDPLKMSQYAFSKYLGELYTLYSPLQNAVAIRFSTIFYENPVKDGLSNLLNSAVKNKSVNIINGGIAKRDFLPVEILIRYLNKICELPNERKIYNVCSGESTSFAEIVKMLKKILPNLIVEDKKMESSVEVLSTFSTASLSAIGKEEFSLSDYVYKYIDKLIKI